MTSRRSGAGFTLLEVLVALSILSIVGIFLIRACGDTLTQVAETGWLDEAARLGRARMAECIRLGIRGNMEGTFAPRRPELRWKATFSSRKGLPGRVLTFTVFERQGGRRHELILEQILFP